MDDRDAATIKRLSASVDEARATIATLTAERCHRCRPRPAPAQGGDVKDITETAKRVLALSEQAASEALPTRHRAGCDVLTTHPSWDPTCTCGLAAARVAVTAYRTDAPALAAYVATVAPLVERLRTYHESYVRGDCGVEHVLDEVHIILAADAAARGGK